MFVRVIIARLVAPLGTFSFFHSTMAQPLPSRGPDYEPLPLTHEDHPNALYNAPPSPGPNPSSFHLPSQDIHDGVPYTDDMGIPMSAQPRFIGRALYDDGAGAGVRNSYASSHNTFPSADGASEYAADSVYNLHTGPGRTGAYPDAYRDEPGFFVGEQPMRRRQDEKRSTYASPRTRRKKPIIIGVLILILLLAVVAAVLALTVFKKKSTDPASKTGSSSGNTAASPNGSGTPQGKVAIVTGTDGSTIAAEDGSTFTYSNPYGGTWYWDVNDPFNNGARAQIWSPALNETFHFGVDKIRGCVKQLLTLNYSNHSLQCQPRRLARNGTGASPAPYSSLFALLIFFCSSSCRVSTRSCRRRRPPRSSMSGLSSRQCRPTPPTVVSRSSKTTTRRSSPSRTLCRSPPRA